MDKQQQRTKRIGEHIKALEKSDQFPVSSSYFDEVISSMAGDDAKARVTLNRERSSNGRYSWVESVDIYGPQGATLTIRHQTPETSATKQVSFKDFFKNKPFTDPDDPMGPAFSFSSDEKKRVWDEIRSSTIRSLRQSQRINAENGRISSPTRLDNSSSSAKVKTAAKGNSVH